MATIDLTDHRRAQDAFAAVLANVKSDQLADPSACAEWTVRDVIAHVVNGNERIASRPVTDLSTAEPGAIVAAHAASADASHAVFEAPDGMERIFDVGFGQVPGSILIGLRTTDVLTHAWDIASVTGQDADLDTEVATHALAFSQELIRPDFRGAGRPFAEEQPCPSGRPVADQLAAFLGRPVTAR